MNRRKFLTNTASATIAGAGFFATQRPSVAGQGPGAKVRVGFVGTAHPHAQGKLAAAQDLGDVFDLVGVVEPSAALRDACKSKPEYRSVKWLAEDELFSAVGLQAIFVETDFHSLVPTAARAVFHGLFVHLDKPPGESVGELAKLLTDAHHRGVHVQMGYMLRYNPAFKLCFSAAREGWLGRIFELDATMSTLRPTAGRKDLGDSKGGAMFDLGSHIIDAVVTVLGPPHRVTPFGRRLHGDQDDVVDNQLAVFEYPDAIATVRATFAEPFATDRRQFIVCGENGTLKIRPLEPPQLRLSLQKAAGGYRTGSHKIELQPVEGRYHAQLRDFADIVLGKAKPRWSDDHDLAVQKTLLQACG